MATSASEIRKLEEDARLLEPDSAGRRRLVERVAAHADAFLEERAHFPVFFGHGDTARALYDHPIGERGIGIDAALELLAKNVEGTGVNVTSGRHLGYVPGGGIFHSALGDYLAAVTNRFAGFFTTSPGAVRMENLLLRWMAGVVGYPESAAGNLASGGSISNLTALVTARDEHGIGPREVERAVVYMTDQAHHCIDKALRVAGLGGCVVHRVGVDAGYRMDPAALDEAVGADVKAGLRPWLVVATAGTTNSGAVDPLAEIGQIADRHGLWLHADGAYGALFALCPEGRAVLGGLEAADSMVLDPHKTLFLPYGIGAVLLRDGGKLHRAFRAEADYMRDDLGSMEEYSPSDMSPELTKHFRALRMWLPLQLLGVAPFRAAQSEKIHLARYFHGKLGEIDGFEVGPAPELSIATYRYLPKRGDADDFNRRLVRAVQDDGRIFITPTRLGGVLVLRAAVVSFRTHLDEIDEALEVIPAMARKLESET